MKFFYLLLCVFLCCCDKAFVTETKQALPRGQIQKDSSVAYLVSQKALAGVLSKEHYLIQAYFLEDRSWLELFSHFRGFSLEDGVNIRFERRGEGLLIRLSAPGFPSKILFEREDYFLNSREANFTVEVNNGTNYGFRARVWENFVNRRGVSKSRRDILTGENLIADSLSSDLAFYAKGQGLKWGLKMSRVHLIEGARVSPKLL